MSKAQRSKCGLDDDDDDIALSRSWSATQLTIGARKM